MNSRNQQRAWHTSTNLFLMSCFENGYSRARHMKDQTALDVSVGIDGAMISLDSLKAIQFI